LKTQTSEFNALSMAIAFGLMFSLIVVSHADTVSKMPSGPKIPGRFGAHYTTLKYDAAWDEPWRIGPHADVVVRFDTGIHKFVFWRGTSYIPCWVTDTDIWYTNEFVERSGGDSENTKGCCEPMSDKQCRYSHVRIIENTDARTVIHWRYAPVDVQYNHPFIDAETGWSDWVDEYYTIYPDSVGVRKITAHTTRPDKSMEWQESIVLNQPGTMPEDNIELGAVSVANMKGQSTTYIWTEKGAPEFDKLKNVNILKVNLKARLQPFAIIPPSSDGEHRVITPYKGHGNGTFFNFWNHWPVSQVASCVNKATSTKRPSHSSLCHIGAREAGSWEYYDKGDKWLTKVMLHGMSNQSVTDLVPLAKSWVNAPKLELAGKTFNSTGYDQTERAYQLVKADNKELQHLDLHILADEEHPVINPAFVIKNWGDSDVVLTLDGKEIERGNTFRFGHRHTLESTDLIVWIKTKSTKRMAVVLLPTE